MSHKLLDAAAATGTSSSIELTSVNYAVQVVATGSPTGITVDLEGSLDGTNFLEIGTISAAGIFFVTDSPVKHVRANLTALTGGTAPTVTVLVGSCLLYTSPSPRDS